MPALTLFGRRWRIGTDDFVIPSLFDLFFTVIWLIASVIIYWKSDSNLEFLECANGHYMKIYLYGVFTILHLIIVTSIVLINSSKNGGIMETEKRRFVLPCLYIRLFLQVLEIGWNILGTCWALNGVFNCSNVSGANTLVKAFIICHWTLVVLGLIGIIIVFDPLGVEDATKVNSTVMDFFQMCADSDSVTLSDIPETKLTKVWTRRLRTLLLAFHTWSATSKNAFHESGKLFGTVFASTDLVPTDVVSGLVLLALRNRDANKDETVLQNSLTRSDKEKMVLTDDQQEYAPTPVISNIPEIITAEPLKSISKKSNVIKPQGLEKLFLNDWRNSVLLSHYLKYAMACYSWPLVLFDRKPGAIRRVLKRIFLRKCVPFREHPQSVTEDDCCFCHTAGVREFVGIDDEQLVHLCFKNKVFNTPFFVAKDSDTKTIILAIRGTMSLTDLLTDMCGWPCSIDYPGLPPTFKAHHGMILCAKDVLQQLDSLEILPKLFEENPDYKLVLTGTSLGAGTATIMAMMMKSRYPDLKCYAFSPPGGLLSPEAAEFCNDMVVSIVYGNDIVPRLSIRSIEKLKYAVIDAVQASATPKYRILLGGLSMITGKRPKTIDFSQPQESQASVIVPIPRSQPDSSPCSMTTTTESLPETDSLEGVDSEVFRRSQENLISPDYSSMMKNESNNCDNTLKIDVEACTKSKIRMETDSRLKVPCGEMYMPGRIIYITETENFRFGHNKPDFKGGETRWRIRWAERTEFLEIMVHGRFLGDHLPYRMYKACKVLASCQAKIAENPLMTNST